VRDLAPAALDRDRRGTGGRARPPQQGRPAHLDDEEQKVVPLAAATLTQQKWDALGKRGMSSVPRNKRGIAAGMMLEPLDADDRAYMIKNVPAPVRLLFPLMVERP
jgi:hypothetical protein